MPAVFNSYGDHIRSEFGEKVQKLSLNVGFTCPNRDGTKGRGGCTYCNNNAFKPDYCSPTSKIHDQLEQGMKAFQKRHKVDKFLAYFQAYSNTYGDTDILINKYREALSHPNVVGLVIGTRPDCIDVRCLEYLQQVARRNYVSLEFGIESTLDKTLNRVNRCHSYSDTVAAYHLADGRELHLGGHLILGLPGETREDMIGHAIRISKLPIKFLKLHQLQIVKHTVMANQFKQDPNQFDLFTLEKYVELVVEFLCYLRSDIVIERFASQVPKRLLIAPNWGGVKNFQVTDMIRKRMEERGLKQGCLL